MLKRVFISNLLIMLFANLLVKPFWVFGIDRVVQLRVGHSEYGLYTALLGLTVVFNILLDLGITSYNNRCIATDPQLIRSTLPNLIIAKLVLAGFYSLILATVAFSLGYGHQTILLLAMLMISQMISSFVLFLRSNISANHDFRMDSILSVMDKVLMIVVFSILFFGNIPSWHFDIKHFVLVQIIAYLITAIIAALFITRNYTTIQFDYFSWKEVRTFCLQSLPYALLIFLMGIYMRGDAVILERLSGARETGIFAGGYRLLDICNTLGVLTAGLLLSMFSRIIFEPEKIAGLLEVSVNMIVPISLAISIFCSFHRGQIIELLYYENSGDIPFVFSLLMFGFPAYCLLYIYSTLLTAKGEIKMLIGFAGIGSVLSLLLNILLIPRYGAAGTALVSTIVHWLLCIFSMVAVGKQYPDSFRKSQWLKMLLFILVMSVLNFGLSHSSLSIYLVALANGMTWFALILILGIFNKKKIFAYAKSFRLND